MLRCPTVEFRFDFDRGLETEDQSNSNAGTFCSTICEYCPGLMIGPARFQTKATLSLEDTDRECPGSYDPRQSALDLN